MTSSSAPEATRPNLLAEAGVLNAWRSHFETSQRLVGLLDAELRREVGFGLSDYNLLLLLVEAPARTLRMSVLADRLVFSAPRLTYRIGLLENKGWVVKSACPQDGRAHLITLTDAGWDEFRAAGRIHRAHIAEHFEKALAPGDAEHLLRISRSIAARLQPAAAARRPDGPSGRRAVCHNEGMTTHHIRTIAFPDAELRDHVDARIPDHQHADLTLVVWSADHRDPGVSRDSIDAIVLPYLDAGPTAALLDELPNLELIQLQTTGYDIVADRLGGRAQIATASGVHAAATAEMAVALTLGSLRGIDDAARDMVSRTWNHRRRRSLADRRVLIVGVGGIGTKICRRLEPFEVEITRVGSRARTDDHGRVHGADELPKLLPHAEVVILITPLTDSTHHLVDAEFLAQLPDNALVVNVARGPVIDTDALVEELRSGRLHAALDVVDPEPLPENHPLWGTPNTLLTPHVGGDTTAFVPRIEALLAEQLLRIQSGQDLLNIVEE